MNFGFVCIQLFDGKNWLVAMRPLSSSSLRVFQKISRSNHGAYTCQNGQRHARNFRSSSTRAYANITSASINKTNVIDHQYE
jgi:hypothetical protein